MLYERKQIAELLYMKHRHDTDDTFIKYDEVILDNSTSPYLYNNDIMNGFLKKLALWKNEYLTKVWPLVIF